MTITLCDERVDTTLYGQKQNVIKDLERRSLVSLKWERETVTVDLTEVSLSITSFHE